MRAERNRPLGLVVQFGIRTHFPVLIICPWSLTFVTHRQLTLTTFPFHTARAQTTSGALCAGNCHTPQVLLEHHLKQLRLPSFLREYDKVARQCAAESADYPRYLLRLAELELLDRERRATEWRIH